MMMMMKQQDSTTTTTTTTTAISCGNCGVEERRLLHHVRHRGIFRRLCTTCVLRLHPQSFCPTCFLIYETRSTTPPLPSNDAVICFKCYSSSHSSCVIPLPSNPYICPLCTNPNSPIFTPKNSKDRGGGKEIDKKAAGVLLAAAKIAAGTMSKAAVAARAEAERRAKEAAFTRKRAREALEHLAGLVTKEKLLKKELGLVEVSGSGNVSLHDKNHRTVIANSVVANVGERNFIGDQNRMDRVDSSSEVLAALNAVELKEKEKLQGVKSQDAVSGANSNAVAMEVEENVQNNGSGNEKEKSGDSGHGFNNHDTQGEKVSNGLLPVLDVKPIGVLNVGKRYFVQNKHAREENAGSQQ